MPINANNIREYLEFEINKICKCTVPVSDLNDLSEIPTWDSMSSLSLLISIETEFNLQLDPETFLNSLNLEKLVLLIQKGV